MFGGFLVEFVEFVAGAGEAGGDGRLFVVEGVVDAGGEGGGVDLDLLVANGIVVISATGGRGGRGKGFVGGKVGVEVFQAIAIVLGAFVGVGQDAVGDVDLSRVSKMG